MDAIQSDTPSENTRHTLLYALKKAALRHLDEDLMLCTSVKSWIERRLQQWAALLTSNNAIALLVASLHFRRELMGLWPVLELNQRICNLPNQLLLSQGPLKIPDNFTSAQYLKQICFLNSTDFCNV